jgi:phosphatidylinositol alpha-1,6-mannosyltransferase
MLILTSVISNASYHGGVAAVNQLLLAAAGAASIPGAVVCQNDPIDAEWLKQWPEGFCAEGSRLRLTLAALSRRGHAKGSVILATHIGLAPVGRLIKEITGGQLCVFLHGVEAWRPLSWRTTWGMRACDKVVANSNFTLRNFRESNPSLARIPGAVCYLPARPLASDEPSLHKKDSPDLLRVLLVGRLWGRGLSKGQRQLIQIWPRVVSEFPNAELCLVGAGDGANELKELARQNGVSPSVRLLGQVSDEELRALYASSDLYAMPSWGEGFGLVFAEAMSHGLPCIASRFDAGSEVVVDGVTGILVDPNRSDELLGALRTLLSDGRLRRRMGEAGRTRAKEVFSLRAFNRRVESILRWEVLEH